MFVCFACTNTFSSIILLINHLKQYHGLGTNDIFKCNQNHCYQKFKNIHTFKLHLTRKHKKTSNNNERSENLSYNNEPNEVNLNVISLPNEIFLPNETSLPNESICNFTIDVHQVCKNLKKSIIEFTLNLHNKDNLTRKNILEIQKSIENCITIPILTSLETLISSLNLIEKSELQIIFDQFKRPFGDIKSEYRLLKELKLMNLCQNVTSFIINNEICEIIKNHTPTLDENKFQGALMPLKFQFKSLFESTDILKKNP